MKKIIFAATAAQADQKAISDGTPSVILMERAARGLYAAHHWKGKTAIVCGSGNNGGDGYALGTVLFEHQRDVTVYSVSHVNTEDARYYCEQCLDYGVPVLPYSPGVLRGFDTVVDCVFGVGLSRAPQGIYAAVIDEMNGSGSYIISADIPSGLLADNGITECAVRADVTVTFGGIKPGLLLNYGLDHSGEIVVYDIGTEPNVDGNLIEMHDFKTVFPERKHNCNKGTFGYVSLIGGCREYAGAAKLANLSLSALRSGCGVARLCVAESLAPAVAPYLLESTLCLMPDQDGELLYDTDAIDRCLTGTKAVAVGMGWGSGAQNDHILTYILSVYTGTLILDADALNVLSLGNVGLLRETKANVVITPHPGEFARLSGKSISEILMDPIRSAQEFASKYGVCVLLKGSTTVVTDGEETYLSSAGCPGMATAGSGDVLSGILCGLFGHSRASVLLTSVCGAFLAGTAAQLAQDKVNAYSMTASDTVAYLSDAMRFLLE